jgi:hypothetical protein
MPGPKIPHLPEEAFVLPIVPSDFETLAAQHLGTLPDAEAAMDSDLLAVGAALVEDGVLVPLLDGNLAQIAFVPGAQQAENLDPLVADAGALRADGNLLVSGLETDVGLSTPPPAGATPPPPSDGGGGGGGGGTTPQEEFPVEPI